MINHLKVCTQHTYIHQPIAARVLITLATFAKSGTGSQAQTGTARRKGTLFTLLIWCTCNKILRQRLVNSQPILRQSWQSISNLLLDHNQLKSHANRHKRPPYLGQGYERPTLTEKGLVHLHLELYCEETSEWKQLVSPAQHKASPISYSTSINYVYICMKAHKPYLDDLNWFTVVYLYSWRKIPSQLLLSIWIIPSVVQYLSWGKGVHNCLWTPLQIV